jgi:hypothetical protein
MERFVTEMLLHQAEVILAKGEAHIAQQTSIIDRLETLGIDTLAAWQLLMVLVESQALNRISRDALLKELDNGPK